MPRLDRKNGDKEPNATRDECSRDNSSTYLVFCLVIHSVILSLGVKLASSCSRYNLSSTAPPI